MSSIVRVIVSVSALGALLLRSRFPGFVQTDAINVALLIAALLPWLGTLFDTAEFPGGWKFKFRELETQTKDLEKKIDKTRARIDSLYILGMSPLALGNLKKIASGDFGPYFLGQGLRWQLLYFHGVGYISFKVKGIDEIPQDGHRPNELNLSEYVEITAIGQEYLAIREIIEE